MRQALILKLELESFLDVKWVSSFWRTSKWALAPVRLRRRGRHSPENMRVRNGGVRRAGEVFDKRFE